MAGIDVRKFVNINIQYSTTSSPVSIRDTVILYTTDEEAIDLTFESLAQWVGEEEINGATTDYSATHTKANPYVQMYFANGGNKVRVISTTATTSSDLLEEIKKLDTEEIVVAYANSDDDYEVLKELAQLIESDSSTYYGINQKYILARTTSTTDEDEVANFAVKYSSIEGAEMTIAAYLSTIDFYGTNTIQDYAFTTETITPEENDDEVLEQVLNNNLNVDMTLANDVRNLGGNLKNGLDLVNQFTLIVLQQTLTDRLIRLLGNKIKGQKGVAAIYACLSNELSYYVSNGFLLNNTIWNEGTITTNVNDTTYTLIEDGTSLLNGYYIKILPMSSLTSEQKHNCPNIYIFLSTTYGIRMINIDGQAL